MRTIPADTYLSMIERIAVGVEQMRHAGHVVGVAEWLPGFEQVTLLASCTMRGCHASVSAWVYQRGGYGHIYNQQNASGDPCPGRKE